MFTQLTSDPALQKTGPGEPRSWRWSQHWRDVFFAHWCIPESQLLPYLPAGLELDLRDGGAWISAVAFRLERIRLRWLPAFGPVSNFLELNLRSYVRWHGEPAILFLSLHANSRLAVALARWLTPLPYAFAPIDYDAAGDMRQFRTWQGSARERRPLFQAAFSTGAACEEVPADSLDEWLLERYCAFVADKRDKLNRMVVRHPRWQTRQVTAEVAGRGLGEAWGFNLGHAPNACHFSTGVDALLGPFVPVQK